MLSCNQLFHVYMFLWVQTYLGWPTSSTSRPTLSLFSYNGDYIRAQKQNKLYGGLSAILRPLCNCNVAKVSIIKLYQNLIWAYRSTISGLPKYLKKKTCKVDNFYIFGYAENTTSVSWNQILKPLIVTIRMGIVGCKMTFQWNSCPEKT